MRCTSTAAGSSRRAAATTTSRRRRRRRSPRRPTPASPTSDAAIAAARRAFDSGPWAARTARSGRGASISWATRCMERADEFFALSQAEWGCTANERMIQIDGPAFMAMHAAELAAAARRRADRSVRGRRNHAASSRAAGCGVDPDAVELPAQPQRDEGEPCVGRRQHRRAQAITADPARRPRARANHRRAHRHPARRRQRRHAERRSRPASY